jgi:hypothetical protein
MNAAGLTDVPEQFSFRILPERKLVLIAVRGSFTTYVLADAMTAIYKSPQWQPGFDILWDLRRISDWAIDWDDMQGFIDLDRELAELSGDGCDVVLADNEIHLANIEAYAVLSRENPRSVVPAGDIGTAAKELKWSATELSEQLEELQREL